MNPAFYSLETLCLRSNWPVCLEMVEQFLFDLANENNT